MNRREMLRLGAAGAGGLLISSAASSVPLPVGILTAPPVPPRAPVPAAPIAPTAPSGINPLLFQKAKAALDSRPWIRNRDFIGIVDFAKASADARFHVVHLPSGHVATCRVAPGHQLQGLAHRCRHRAGWFERNDWLLRRRYGPADRVAGCLACGPRDRGGAQR